MDRRKNFFFGFQMDCPKVLLLGLGSILFGIPKQFSFSLTGANCGCKSDRQCQEVFGNRPVES